MCTYEFYNPFHRNCNCGQNFKSSCNSPCQGNPCNSWQTCPPCQSPCQPCIEPFPPQPPFCPPDFRPIQPPPVFPPIPNKNCCNELIWLLIGMKLAKNNRF